MSAETVAVAALNNGAPVVALVSDRIYPDFVAGEKALPAIAVTRAATEYITTIHQAVPLGAIVNLEIWCLADSRSAAEDLATKAVTALAAAGFVAENRSPEFDAESEVFATVLTVSILE